mmetsp:Transcript_38203/g.119895  ORF Transcript_38203/g.119895 Transcript_38203/m.119895 type:complete len:234 (-) Transcript_38203:571-1272(-)
MRRQRHLLPGGRGRQLGRRDGLVLPPPRPVDRAGPDAPHVLRRRLHREGAPRRMPRRLPEGRRRHPRRRPVADRGGLHGRADARRDQRARAARGVPDPARLHLAPEQGVPQPDRLRQRAPDAPRRLLGSVGVSGAGPAPRRNDASGRGGAAPADWHRGRGRLPCRRRRRRRSFPCRCCRRCRRRRPSRCQRSPRLSTQPLPPPARSRSRPCFAPLSPACVPTPSAPPFRTARR